MSSLSRVHSARDRGAHPASVCVIINSARPSCQAAQRDILKTLMFQDSLLAASECIFPTDIWDRVPAWPFLAARLPFGLWRCEK